MVLSLADVSMEGVRWQHGLGAQGLARGPALSTSTSKMCSLWIDFHKAMHSSRLEMENENCEGGA